MPRDSGAVRERNNASQSPVIVAVYLLDRACVGYTKSKRRLTSSEGRDDGFGQHPKRDLVVAWQRRWCDPREPPFVSLAKQPLLLRM